MTTSTSRRIAHELSASILRGEMKPGERLRQEELAESFGTSRVPVREALYLLESEQLIRLVSNTGAWVTSLTQEECIGAYRMREALEPLLLEQSLDAMTEAQDDELASLHDRIIALPLDDITEFLLLDRELHWTVYRSAEKTYLGETVRKLWNITQYYRSEFVRLRGSQGRPLIHLEHALFLDAVKRRNAQDAGEIMAQHIRRTRLSLSEHPEIFELAGVDD